MNRFNSDDLVAFNYYFFVYDGIVYYGYAGYSEWIEPEEFCVHEPTRFIIKDSRNMSEEREVCNVWEAELIYTLLG